MKSKLQNFKMEVQALDKVVYLYTNNPAEYNLSDREIQKRKDKVESLKERVEDVNAQILGELRNNVSPSLAAAVPDQRY